MTRLTRFDGPADCMKPVDDTHFGHLVLSFEIGLLKGFLVLDRSAVNCSPLPLGEERLGGGRLAAFTESSALCFERRLSVSVFFVTPCPATREFCDDFFPCFPSVRFAGRCADRDCLARDFRSAAFFPSVFSGPSWETSVPPCLKDRSD